jgi:predicted TIM-barrel fold metal-dependent hydrolase
MKLRFDTRVLNLLGGAIDLHVHSAPDVYPRILNDIELARQAKEMGMRGILIKNHFVVTADRAQLASDEADFPVFGGIALNLSVGGLNHHAVDVALKLGAKVVWLPTLHARKFIQNKHHVANLAGELGEGIQGIYVLNEDGSLKDEMYPILDLIAEKDVILATGHVTFEEARVVVREAAERGIKKIVVTHPLASFVNYSLGEMKEILDLGATYLEHVYNDTTRQVGQPIKIQDLYDTITAIGPAHCIMSTDAGQWLNPVPVQQMGIYIKDMLNLGLPEADIRTMVADNPARALGL